MPTQGSSKISPELLNDLCERYRRGSTLPDLVIYCSQLGHHIGRRTIQRAFQKRELKKLAPSWKTLDTAGLRLRIAFLYYTECLPDDVIIDVLRDEGFDLTSYMFVRIRRAMGIRRRLHIAEFEERYKEYRSIVQKELDKRTIDQYGRGLLYVHFRRKQSLNINLGRYELQP